MYTAEPLPVYVFEVFIVYLRPFFHPLSAASVGFQSSFYSYTEGQALSEEDYPLMLSSHPTLPITMLVSQSESIYL